MKADQLHKLRRLLLAALLFAGTGALAHPSADEQGPAVSSSSAAREEFAEAEKLRAQGLLERARAAALKGVQADPRSVEGYNLLGIIESDRKDFAGALEAFRAALKISPRSVPTHNNLGKVYVAQNKMDLAESEFRAAIRLDSRHRDANYNLGVLLIARGRPAEAIPFFLRVRPADETTRLSLVRAYLRAGRKARARDLAQAISARAGNDVRLHFSLGVLLASENQPEQALHEFEIADALEPRSFEILEKLGEADLRTGRIENALTALTQALELRPDSVEARVLLGEAYAGQRKDLEALEVLTRARQLAPRNTDVILLLARLSMLESFHEDAIALLEEGVKIDPQRPDLHAALAESYFTVGKVDKALAEFETLIRLDPSAPSFASLGLCYRYLGRFKEARKYLEEGLRIDPRNVACLVSLGSIENKQGNAAQAEKLLQQALRANPNSGEALYELASVKVEQKKFEEALPLLRRAVKASAKPAQAYYKLASVERVLHQTDAATRDLKIFQTLSKDPDAGQSPYQNLFEYLNQRLALPARAKTEADLRDILAEVERHPERPKNLYLLAETLLKLGRVEEARKAVAQLDRLSGGDARTALGVGALLARYRLYAEAIEHFHSVLAGEPSSDDARFDLAETYSQLGDFPRALEAVEQLSPQAAGEEAALALRADLYARLGRTSEAVAVFEKIVAKDPDNDQAWLSLALTKMRAGALRDSGESLRRGLARVPNSAKLHWGAGVLAVLEGENALGEEQLMKSVELMPEWQASLSSLGVFYYQTGQVSKAREMLRRSMELNPQSGLNVAQIEQVLDASSRVGEVSRTANGLSPEARRQFLEIALALADQRP